MVFSKREMGGRDDARKDRPLKEVCVAMCERESVSVSVRRGGEVASPAHEERNASIEVSIEVMRRVEELLRDKCIRCILEFREDRSICSHCFSLGRNYAAHQKLQKFREETGYELLYCNGEYVLRRC